MEKTVVFLKFKVAKVTKVQRQNFASLLLIVIGVTEYPHFLSFRRRRNHTQDSTKWTELLVRFTSSVRYRSGLLRRNDKLCVKKLSALVAKTKNNNKRFQREKNLASQSLRTLATLKKYEYIHRHRN